MHEILSIQLGPQSNYLSTHFWNAQESYFTYPPEDPSPVDHNIHFRPGVTRTGQETFTPRALVYDFKEGFGALGGGGLYEEGGDGGANDSGVWQGRTVTERTPQIPQSAYHRALSSEQGLQRPLLPSDIRSFTDYLTPFYHPRSLHPLSVLSLSQSTLPSTATSASSSNPTGSSSFQTWCAGEELFNTLNHDHIIIDEDLRFWVEECDALQGVQIIVDVDSAWGGFANGFLEGVRDELGGKGSVWIWAVNSYDPSIQAPEGERKRANRLLNQAHSMYELSSQSSLYVPVNALPTSTTSTTAPYVDLAEKTMWQTSALQSVAMETATLSSRLKHTVSEGNRGLLREIEEAVQGHAERRIAKLSMSARPQGGAASKNGIANGHTPHLNGGGGPPANGSNDNELDEMDIDLFSNSSNGLATSGKEHIFGRSEMKRGSRAGGGSILDSDDDEEDQRLSSLYGGPVVERYRSKLPYPILPTTPSIFSFPHNNPPPKNLAMHSSLQTSTTVSSEMQRLERIVRPLVGVEEREAMCNGLRRMAEEYTEGWDSGSDGGEDWE